MRIFRILGKSISNAFKSIVRNFSLSLASISCTAITLMLVAIALLTTYNVNSMTENIEGSLTIIAFIDNSATDEEIEDIKTKVNAIDNIDESKTIYRSKDEIKNELLQDEKIKDTLEALDTNPLSSTLVLSVTLFLNENTIKITIFSRKNEIGIMRLVGTSNTVIKMPFIFEGFILGLIGSIIPILITIFGYTYLYDVLGGKIYTDLLLLVKPSTIIYSSSFVLAIIGSLVGVFGSLKAVRRYLKI